MGVVRLRDVVKINGQGRAALRVLDGLDLAVEAGELVAVTGRSGSGKSTLLNVVGALDRADSGVVEVAGVRIDRPPSGCWRRCGATGSASSSRPSTCCRS
jgi:ABC-type lipoprotein export system ATPase subunit